MGLQLVLVHKQTVAPPRLQGTALQEHCGRTTRRMIPCRWRQWTLIWFRHCQHWKAIWVSELSHRVWLTAGMRGNMHRVKLQQLRDSASLSWRQWGQTVPAMDIGRQKERGRKRPAETMLKKKSRREINPLSAVRRIRSHWTTPRQNNRPGRLNAPVVFMTPL